MSQSFLSIRERFESITSENPTVASGIFQKYSYTRAASTAIYRPLPPAVASPEKNPPPCPVTIRVPSNGAPSRGERSEKVLSFSETIKQQSRSLRVAPKVPKKPVKLVSEYPTIKTRPITPPKPSQSEKIRPSSPTPSPKFLSQTSPQRVLSVNRLRQQFEQARDESQAVSKKSEKSYTIDVTRISAQLNGNHVENHLNNTRKLSWSSAPESKVLKPVVPVSEHFYDDPVYHRKVESSVPTSDKLKSEESRPYVNITNQRLRLLELTTPIPHTKVHPLPSREPIYENFAAYERKMSESSTLSQQSVLFENLLDSPASILSFDSDFDDDDEEEFGEVSKNSVHKDEAILGKHFALNHAHDRFLSGMLPRQRFSYAAPETRPELKSRMSFNHKTQERPPVRNKDTPDDSEKYDKKLQNIAGELISTEKVFVENLTRDFQKFSEMFNRRDIPRGLKDKQETLFGNIEEIINFHRNTVLPMFEKNQKDLNSLFDQFSVLLDDHRFYEYVIFATNNKNSFKIVDDFLPYFQYFQKEIDDPLGIQSFLLLPIQRLPRYELFLNDFKKALFEACSHSSKYSTQKSQVKALCDLEKKMKSLLNLMNEANVVCDIIGWTNLNLFNRENRFRKVLDDLFIYDYDQQQGYGGKIFIFDKFMIYTEVRGDVLIYRGCYDVSKRIDLIAEEKAFKMAHRRVQVCNFHSETATHNLYCLSFIEDMIQSNRMSIYDQRGYGSNTSSGNMSTLQEEDEC